MDDLYQEVIMDHVNNPRNFGTLTHPTLVLKESNASCGDMVEMQFEIKNGTITDVKWRSVGCAISTASTSILSELVKGKKVSDAKSMTQKVLMKEMGLKSILPTREKCLLLPLKLLHHLH